MSTPQTDLDLLKEYEPVLMFTKGEQFFPMQVEPYIERSSLWEAIGGDAREVIPEGHLDKTTLAQAQPSSVETVQYMRFAEPLSYRAMASYIRNYPRDFKPSMGRLARVGLGARLLDTLFSITLILRGRVPGGTHASAHLRYLEIMEDKEEYAYYGRVLREHGYTVLQYWYFYCMNDWRSGFNGVNDHEADWEHVAIYLAEDADNCLRPEWVAYSSHDFAGDDFRRRWDDRELTIIADTHPLVYIGAGSHGAYFQAGEYLHEVEVPFSGVLQRIARPIQQFWRNTLRQQVIEANEQSIGLFSVPFVDYARGDGLSIGASQEKEWTANLIPNSPGRSFHAPYAWLEEYRGLWGLYARDPVAGENAPAGPKFWRDGTVRQPWFDPLGWVGLGKVPPRANRKSMVLTRIEAAHERIRVSRDNLRKQELKLSQLWTEAEAMKNLPHLQARYRNHMREITAVELEVKNEQALITEERALSEALQDLGTQYDQGRGPASRDHLHRPLQPVTEQGAQLGRLAETWAAVSMGVLIIASIMLVLFAPNLWIVSLLAVVGVTMFIEALFRREARKLVQRTVILLSLVSAGIILVEFFIPALVLAVIGLGVFIIIENLIELVQSRG